MTKEEYKAAKEAAHEVYKKELSKIMRSYAIQNNPYCVGDLVRDHIGWARIKDMRVRGEFMSEMPCMIYTCDNLTARGLVNKREPEREVCQYNIVESRMKSSST